MFYYFYVYYAGRHPAVPSYPEWLLLRSFAKSDGKGTAFFPTLQISYFEKCLKTLSCLFYPLFFRSLYRLLRLIRIVRTRTFSPL